MSVPTYQSNQNLVLNNAFGSNVNNSTVLTSFPTTATTAQGHYHFTDTYNNALKLLNASNDEIGGHEFWNCTSTSSPVKTLDVNKDRLLIDSSLTNSSGNTNLSLAYNNLTFTDDTFQCLLNNEAFIFYSGGASNVRINNSSVNPNIFFNNGIHSSQLTESDLTFDGVSVLSQIERLQIKQTNLINVYSSPAIYADGRPPATVPLTSSNTYAQFGWYFKNTVAGYKINWYFAPDTNQTVGDILGLYLRLFNCSTTSNDNTPFLIIYTKPTGSGDYSSWFHSSMVYILDTTITPTINTSYTFFKNVSGTCPDPKHYASTLANMIQSPVNNPRGTYLPSEEILTIAIGSNSASATNSVEFIGQKLGLMTSSGTQEFALSFQL
jgi:hypothetical protein